MALCLAFVACGLPERNALHGPPADAPADAAMPPPLAPPATPPSAPPPAAPPVGYPPTPADLRAFVDATLERAHAPGAAACIVKSGRVAWCDGFGFAHLGERRVPTPDTPFLLASISKTVTAVALMSLEERGVLALDQPVAPALPFGLAHPRSATPITYRQLLTHTAGIADNWDLVGEWYAFPPSPDEGSPPPFSLAVAMQGYFDRAGRWYAPANFTAAGPGTAWEYSNCGIALAAYLGELLSGRDFAALVDERVLVPLGMTRSSFRWSDVADLGVAMPYTWQAASGTYEAAGHYTFADYPDGGLFASAADLARFELAIASAGTLDGVRILDPDTVARMLTHQVPAIDDRQGIVFYSSDWLGDTWWGHGGDETGVATDMHFRPRDGLGYVLLLNGDRDEEGAGDAIQERLVTFGETL